MSQICLIVALVLALASPFGLGACVDQHPERQDGNAAAGSVTALAGEASSGAARPERVVATSGAIVEMCAKLELDLVGVPHSDLYVFPERYADVERVGPAMSPDMELLASIKPDLILSPNSLEPDLSQRYEAAGLEGYFCNMRSVDGMYETIDYLGKLLDRQSQAADELALYEAYIAEYKACIAEAAAAGKQQPTVLLLMGLPGSYVVATENSYIGSLVAQAGGINAYAGEAEEFISVNTEDMLARDPDIILRASHALPDKVMAMFAEEFSTNDIWKHFRAVKEGRVHDLPYESFGMSARFNYPQAHSRLYELLYG